MDEQQTRLLEISVKRVCWRSRSNAFVDQMRLGISAANYLYCSLTIILMYISDQNYGIESPRTRLLGCQSLLLRHPRLPRERL